MEAADAADTIREAAEEGERGAAERFRRRAAVTIAVLAMLLALTSLGGANAGKETTNNNIQASDTYAFYQAKAIRQTQYQLAADELRQRLDTALRERAGAGRAAGPGEAGAPRPGAGLRGAAGPRAAAGPELRLRAGALPDRDRPRLGEHRGDLAAAAAPRPGPGGRRHRADAQRLHPPRRPAARVRAPQGHVQGRRGGASASPVDVMKSSSPRVVVGVAGRLLPTLAALLDPEALVVRVVARRPLPPDPLAIVLLLALAGCALYLWWRDHPRR